MVNNVTLLGRLGKDPEVRRLDNGTPVASFTMATTKKWKDQRGEIKEDTQWHNITAWRNLAETLEKYVKKGDILYVEGEITYKKYTDKNDVEKWGTEIIANEIKLLPNGKKSEGAKEEEDIPIMNEDTLTSYATVKGGQMYEAKKGGNKINIKEIKGEFVYYYSEKRGDELQKMKTSEFEANVLPLYNQVFATAEESAEESEGDDLPF